MGIRTQKKARGTRRTTSASAESANGKRTGAAGGSTTRLLDHDLWAIYALFDLPWERQLLDAGYLPQGL